jgi:DNA-binding transcriptional regulator of glucitol operon
VIAAAATCLALGWWQWGRFESAHGTAQNLGYALQWPLFAGFFVWAYFRFVHLEREAQETESPQTEPPQVTAGAPDAPPGQRRKHTEAAAPREIPPGILPERPAVRQEQDPVLAEYNRYLAELHAHDLRQQPRDAGLEAHDTERSAG